MPASDGPKFSSGPPRSGRAPAAKAAGKVDPPDAPEVVASTEPDDDLSDYVIPAEPEVVDAGTVPDTKDAGVQPDPGQPVAPEPTPGPYPEARVPNTAETELVASLRADLARAEARLAGVESNPDNWSAGPAPKQLKDGDKILIHVRRDGFTANGRVWYRGQELEFTVGEQNYRDTLDRNGNSWLTLSEAEQLRRYDEVQFGFGPWPGDSWDHPRAQSAEANRGRTAPTITQITNVTDQKSTRL